MYHANELDTRAEVEAAEVEEHLRDLFALSPSDRAHILAATRGLAERHRTRMRAARPISRTGDDEPTGVRCRPHIYEFDEQS
jgi:hypothetical protein